MSPSRLLQSGLRFAVLAYCIAIPLSAQDFSWKPVQGSDTVDYRWRYSVYCPEGSSACAKEFEFHNRAKKYANFDYAIYVESGKEELVQGGSIGISGDQISKVPLSDGLKVTRVQVRVHK